MRFSQVPQESKKQINKAGHVLVQTDASKTEFEWALDLADRWRACHAYPINTFQSTLRDKLRHYPGDPIVAQRLKRMPTIIDKLKRFPNMQLTTMQDIGGVRAVMASIDDVNSLADQYKNSRRLAHQLVEEKNYIHSPRSEDGYRSLHLIYKYKNLQVPTYDGLRLELQIRTKLQHIWATAVETMGTFLGQALKSRKGDQEWLDFFATISSAFAMEENCAPVPRFSKMNMSDTFLAVAEAESKLNALHKMNAFSVAVQEITNKDRGAGKGWSYHLIVLNSMEKTVQIMPYDRDSFTQAVADYSLFESQAAKGMKIEPVLVSAGPIDKLRRAYPNFFLDINDFEIKVRQIIDTAKFVHGKM